MGDGSAGVAVPPRRADAVGEREGAPGDALLPAVALSPAVGALEGEGEYVGAGAVREGVSCGDAVGVAAPAGDAEAPPLLEELPDREDACVSRAVAEALPLRVCGGEGDAPPPPLAVGAPPDALSDALPLAEARGDEKEEVDAHDEGVAVPRCGDRDKEGEGVGERERRGEGVAAATVGVPAAGEGVGELVSARAGEALPCAPVADGEVVGGAVALLRAEEEGLPESLPPREGEGVEETLGVGAPALPVAPALPLPPPAALPLPVGVCTALAEPASDIVEEREELGLGEGGGEEVAVLRGEAEGEASAVGVTGGDEEGEGVFASGGEGVVTPEPLRATLSDAEGEPLLDGVFKRPPLPLPLTLLVPLLDCGPAVPLPIALPVPAPLAEPPALLPLALPVEEGDARRAVPVPGGAGVAEGAALPLPPSKLAEDVAEDETLLVVTPLPLRDGDGEPDAEVALEKEAPPLPVAPSERENNGEREAEGRDVWEAELQIEGETEGVKGAERVGAAPVGVGAPGVAEGRPDTEGEGDGGPGVGVGAAVGGGERLSSGGEGVPLRDGSAGVGEGSAEGESTAEAVAAFVEAAVGEAALEAVDASERVRGALALPTGAVADLLGDADVEGQCDADSDTAAVREGAPGVLVRRGVRLPSPPPGLPLGEGAVESVSD